MINKEPPIQIEEKLNCSFYKRKGLFKCNTCTGIYCLNDMHRHRIKKEKYTDIITLDKCKNKIKQTLNQGDRIETPQYIEDNNLKIDYKYYLDHQIIKPSMQLFSLTMDNPITLLQDILDEEKRKQNGMKSLAAYGFGV